MEILFVCSGNVIRSALAEGLLRKILVEIGVKDVVVSSAGTLGLEGRLADPDAQRLALGRGFNLDGHRSRGLSSRDVLRADMIVVMERAHRLAVERIDPAAVERTRLLREFEVGEGQGRAVDLADPIGAGQEAYAGCFETLDRCVTNLAFHLKYRHGS